MSKRFPLFLLVVITWFSPWHAQAANGTVAPNGISVSEPKLYEERSLRLMLEAAEARLAALGFIDQAKLTGAVGTVQGGTAKTSSVFVEASPIPTAGVSDKVESVEDSTGTKTTRTKETTREKFDASPPTQESLEAATVSTTGIGLSARDLLAEQLSMTYEVANLRLAMERSVSDRFARTECSEDADFATCYRPREPVLLGFQVSLDPPDRYKNAVAEIEITTTQPDYTPTLVTLLPSKDAYNVSALTRDTKGVALGAIAGVFQVGVGARRNRDTYYLLRQADTVGLRFPSSPESLSFGWQFRPVLGKPIVDSGIRPVFALLTIPAPSGPADKVELKIVTRWRKWNPRTGVVRNVIMGSPNESTQTLYFSDILGAERHLQPVIHEIHWVETGPDQALVTVVGESFLGDTKVVVGQTTYDQKSGLNLSSERAISFVTPLSQLSSIRSAFLVGRYLDRVPLINYQYQNQDVRQAHISKVEPLYLGDGRYLLTIKVGGFDRDNEPVVVLGSTVFVRGGINPLQVIPDERGRPQELRLEAKPELLRSTPRVIVRDLFGGDALYAESKFELPEDFIATKLVVIARTSTGVIYGVLGSNFDGNTEVQIGEKTFKAPPELTRSNFFTITPTWADVRGVEQAVIRKGTRLPPVVLPLKDAPEVKKPQFVGTVKIVKGLSKPVEFSGTDLGSITKVTFEGEELVFKVTGEGTKLEVEITTKVTAETGDKALKLTLIDGSIVYLPFMVVTT